jgi:hypothetical protein
VQPSRSTREPHPTAGRSKTNVAGFAIAGGAGGVNTCARLVGGRRRRRRMRTRDGSRDTWDVHPPGAGHDAGQRRLAARSDLARRRRDVRRRSWGRRLQYSVPGRTPRRRQNASTDSPEPDSSSSRADHCSGLLRARMCARPSRGALPAGRGVGARYPVRIPPSRGPTTPSTRPAPIYADLRARLHTRADDELEIMRLLARTS